VILASITGLLFAFFNKPDQNESTPPPVAILHTNKDTGEQTLDDPGLSDTESEDTKTVIIYGMPDFIEKTDIYQSQIDFIKTELTTYNNQNLKGAYTALTIRPQDVIISNDKATTTIRLGDSDILVNLQVNGVKSGVMQVLLTDPSGKGGGNYSSQVKEKYND